MCDIWQNASKVEDEITPEIIEKLPSKLNQINITGGEPMMRSDIADIIAVADKRTSRVILITNGYYTDKILDIAKKFPDITIRISVEGLAEVNDEIRGIENGFNHALRTAIRLKEIGIKDVGLSALISDENMEDLLDLYHLSVDMNLDFICGIKQNSFYFFKNDNKVDNLKLITEKTQELINQMLHSKRGNLRLKIKDWFRAYMNNEMLRNMYGDIRSFPCGASTERFFLDPFGKILACIGSEEPLIMGDLKESDFEEIWKSEQTEKIRDRITKCNRNCWMQQIVAPALKKRIHMPVFWIIKNKLGLFSNSNLKSFQNNFAYKNNSTFSNQAQFIRRHRR